MGCRRGRHPLNHVKLVLDYLFFLLGPCGLLRLGDFLQVVGEDAIGGEGVGVGEVEEIGGLVNFVVEGIIGVSQRLVWELVFDVLRHCPWSEIDDRCFAKEIFVFDRRAEIFVIRRESDH